MKQFILLFVFLLFSSLGINAQRKNNFKTYKLENGLTIILDQDISQSQVIGMVAANVGAKDEEENATGLAHYLEHMLFKGTQTLGTADWKKEKPLINKIYTLYDKLQSAKDQKEIQKINDEINQVSQEASQYAIPNEFSKIIEQMGGIGLNATTSFDVTKYYNIFPPNQLEPWLDLYAHRFEKPVFRMFQTELEAVYEEKNRAEDEPSNAYNRKLLENVFKGHPYSRPVLGYTEHLKRPNISKMKAFFQKWYVPENMVIILSGNFKIAQAESLIAEKFGKWKARPCPKRRTVNLPSFNGKQKIKVKLSPFLKAQLVYTIPPPSIDENLALDVASELLSNSSKTGLLNKLNMNGEVLYAIAANETLKDINMFSISFAPVFDINQRRQMSFKSAESLIENEIKKLKKGDYESWLLKQIKANMIDQYDLSMESPTVRANRLLQAFIHGRAPESIFNYKKRLANVDKAAVSRVVKKYIGRNYLAFYSYKGEAPKEKIEKPKIDPIKPQKHENSEYAKYFEGIPTTQAEHKFVNFDTDTKVVNFQNKVNLHYVPNKHNDVFSMQIVFNVGTTQIPMLEYATSLMNNAGIIGQYKPDELRREFGKLGITYSFYSNDYKTFIEMRGNEKKLAEACQLLSRLMIFPKIEEKSLNRIVGSEYQSRMIEAKMQTRQVAALKEYVQYENESKFIKRASLDALTAISPTELTGKFNHALSYKADIYYYGKTPLQKINKILKQNIAFASNRKEGEKPKQRASKKYSENTIFLVDNPNVSQSNIFIFIKGQPISLEEIPLLDAFNQYFSGGFTGLMMKEIREFRSLAYTASAEISTPKFPEWDSNFYATIGTQGDKTLEAIEVSTNLINNMPQYPKRISSVKSHLINSSFLARPTARNMSQVISLWQQKGYKEDPIKKNLPLYEQIQFKSMLDFYKKHLQNKTYAIGIVGPLKKIDTNALKKYGKIIKIKSRRLFSEN